MIAFSAPEDREWLAELRERGLLTPMSLERIAAALGDRPCDSLEEFLLAGAGIVPDPEWLSWLIRAHGCHRFGPVRLWKGAADWPVTDADLEGPNLPYRRLESGQFLVAVLRPTRPIRGLPAAATLGEMVYLREAWARLRS